MTDFSDRPTQPSGGVIIYQIDNRLKGDACGNYLKEFLDCAIKTAIYKVKGADRSRSFLQCKTTS